MRVVALSLWGCAAQEPVLEVATDGGSWTVSMEAPEEEGVQGLRVTVEPADGELVEARVSMPDMGHSTEGEIAVLEPGTFEVTVDISMSGWWVLDGRVAQSGGEGAEGFRLEFEVP